MDSIFSTRRRIAAVAPSFLKLPESGLKRNFGACDGIPYLWAKPTRAQRESQEYTSVMSRPALSALKGFAGARERADYCRWIEHCIRMIQRLEH
jgi:hypothetical protein